MSALGEALQELKSFGLLDRTLKLKVGEIEVLMDGATAPEPAAQSAGPLTAAEEKRKFDEVMYGASQNADFS